MNSARRALATVAAISMALTACSSSDPRPAASGPGGGGFVGLRGSAPTLLQEGRSCDDVLEDFQTFAPAVLRDGFGFRSVGEEIATTTGAMQDDGATDSAAPAPDAMSESMAGGDGSTSDTNTQEEGIDEPDVVETDGDFVYVVDGDGLVILDASTAAVLSRTPLAGHGAQLLLSGDRVLAITGGGYGIGGPMPVDARMAIEDIGRGEPATEPLAGPIPVDPPSFPTGTVIQLIDVSDRAAPVTVETTELEGQHLSTRVVDGVARVVLSSRPQPVPFDMPVDDQGDLEAAVSDGVADTAIDDWLPSFRTSTGSGSTSIEGQVVDCQDVLVPEVNAGLAETSVLRVDFEDGFDPAHTTTVVAEAGTVYASASTLYIAATRYVGASEQTEIRAEDWSTAIHAFDLRGDGAAVHVGAGEVPGNTLNQYSLSEHDGYLRIATTEGTPWGAASDSESAVRVLRLDGDALVEVGVVGGLGKTETIQSVRFMGPVGYVVTFRQTDPLYVIDLSDPTAPEAVGELKIPGFSSYLHPVGEGRLVGVGRDASLEGVDQGFLVSLFDVSDPTEPRQIQTHTERDAHSAAGQDAKAFLWWAPESAVVVPIERFGASVQNSPAGFEIGMTVLGVDDSGITERATVTAGGRYPSRALVVQGQLWSLFDGGVVTSGFDGGGRQFHPFR